MKKPSAMISNLSVFTITSVTFDDVDDSVLTLPETTQKAAVAGHQSH